jgi:Spy/CpxP family protein refolding chaperone
MKFINIILSEGRRDDFVNKFRNKFSNEELKKIIMLSQNLSPNNKFLMFLGNVMPTQNFDENLSKAQKAVESFIKYQQALEEKDINKYQSLEDIMQAIDAHENKVRRKVKEVEGADVVYEDDRFTVVTPKTHKASCYYGAGTKWCTASMNGDSHFNNYNVDGKLFYFIDKKGKSNDRFYKVALLQKYDGDKTYYDAPDKSFSSGWILGSEEYQKIQKVIDEYIANNFSREVEIFKDKEKARLERDRIRQQQQAQMRARRLRSAEQRKENDEWNLDDNDDVLAEMANAVYNIIQDSYGVVVEEDEDIYNLLPAESSHYGLPTFEWMGEDDQGLTMAIGDWDQVYEAAKEYTQNLWDDMGSEAFSQSFVENYIDEDSIRSYFEDLFENDVRYSPESWFDDEDLPLSNEQVSEIAKLEEEKETLDEIIANHGDEYTDDEIELAEDRFKEIEDEIEDINNNPEGEPTEEMIENIVSSLVDEKMYDVVNSMSEYGMEIDEYVDVDRLIEDVVDMDGIGPALSSYDGDEHEEQINGTWYHAIRVE